MSNIFCEVQLGDLKQTVYKVSANGDYSVIGNWDINFLGKIACDYYFDHNIEKMIICGPVEITSKIAQDAQSEAARYYDQREILIELIKR